MKTHLGILLCALVNITIIFGEAPEDTHIQTGHECPSQTDPLGLHRVNCYPEGHVTMETCKSRGCCYDNTAPTGSRAPACFFPKDYGYEVHKAIQKDGNTWLGQLKGIKTPSMFGGDIDLVAILVEEQTNNRLRIKFYDPYKERAEVPFIKIPNPAVIPDQPLYSVEFINKPFSVRVTRRCNNQVIFDTSMGGFVFSDQFLQLSAHIASPHLYGLGEHLHTDSIKHNMDWKTWSIHAAGKHPTGPEARNLYGSHPVYLNLEDDGNANMVLLLNQHAMDVVLQPTPAVTFRTIGGVLDFYIFMGEWIDSESWEDSCDSESEGCGPNYRGVTPAIQAIQEYIKATGLPVMPPYWALGFQLSRWNYTDSQGLRDVITRNREAGIPFDVQWGDVDYMHNSQTFTIDQERFADLPDIVKDLHKHNQRYVAIHDPAIKSYPAGVYKAYDDGTEHDVWIKHSDGTILEGEVWPGVCVFVDFTKDEARQWWREQAIAFHETLPFDGFWIDMNEPSTFMYGSTRGCEENTWNQPPYLPKITGDVLWNRTLCMDSVQALGRHYDVHSLYGHSMSNATYFAGKAIFGDKRFVVVSRSTFVGSGQFTSKWLGDNKSSFLDMKWSITGIIEFNMFGFPYVGADICGFFQDTEEQLCQRWIQLGAFYPMSRSHNQNNTRPQDPASFSQSFIDSSKSVLLTRYRLLPYLYTLFHHAHTQGSPVVRPLAFEFPLDPSALSIDSQFLWGQALMISPVLTNDTFRIKAYFPEGLWYDYYTGLTLDSEGAWYDLDAPIHHINLHIRGGYILPLQKPGPTTHISRKKPFSLLVAYNKQYEAEGSLFWDDGETTDSYLKKDCRIVNLYASKDMLVITSNDAEGHYNPHTKLHTITLYGAADIKSSVVVIKSSKDSLPRKVKKTEWDADKKILKLEELSLDLTDSHYISWMVAD